MGKFVQDVLRPDLELPPHVTCVTLRYISGNAFNKPEHMASWLLMTLQLNEANKPEAYLSATGIGCKQMLLITLKASGGGWFICLKSEVEQHRGNVRTCEPDFQHLI